MRLDPNDLREVIGAYHRCVAETVGRSGGFVAKCMGGARRPAVSYLLNQHTRLTSCYLRRDCKTPWTKRER